MTTSERKPLYGERLPGVTFDMYEGREVVDLFVDGIGKAMIGPQVAKLEFFRLLGTKTEAEHPGAVIEDREMILRVVVPTPVLAEACGNLLSQINANVPRLDESHTILKRLIADAVAKVGNTKL
jgi:hypothetical protein